MDILTDEARADIRARTKSFRDRHEQEWQNCIEAANKTIQAYEAVICDLFYWYAILDGPDEVIRRIPGHLQERCMSEWEGLKEKHRG